MIDVLLMSMAPSIEPPRYEVPAVYQTYERCVAHRESNDLSTVVSSTGKYRGLYQMNDALADSTTYHIMGWIKSWHPNPRQYGKWLRITPVNQWPRAVQTAAFVAILDGHDKKQTWSGKKHFAGGRWAC
jgi:hypothetical protein